MIRPRRTALLLALLDVASSILVFNLMSHFRGVALTDYIDVLQFGVPILALGIALYLIRGYHVHTDMLSVDYASQHAIALMGAMLATLLLTYAVAPPGYELTPQASRIVIGLSFLALIPLTLAYRRVLYMRVHASREVRNFVFLGNIASCDAFHAECEKMGMSQRVIFTVMDFDPRMPFQTASGQKLRDFREVLDEIEQRRLKVEAIILRESARELPAPISRRLVQLYFAGVPTFTLELFHQVYWQKIPVYRLNQTWLFQEGFEITREPVFERIKRASDVMLALAGLVFCAPVIALGALAVWIEDRGPMFFAQMRIGKNHLPFRLYKLRTMRPSTESNGDLYTRHGDARITRVGRVLRATRVDELPQLWNVLIGDMSLIGPRAEWDRLVENYERDIPCYHFRHLVKPGITGWAQVNYPYGANLDDTVRKLEYDLYYIRHFSFLLDASIALKTIHIMLFGKGR